MLKASTAAGQHARLASLPASRPFEAIAVASSCALVLVAVGVAHSGALQNHFFGSDTWPWLVSTHVSSLADLGRVAFSPIMSGTRFASEVALFYHPLTALSYSVDQVLFGLDPLGFYATNLLIHLVSVAALFGLARALGSSWWSAVAAALILGLHPIAAATVPSLPRRQDMVVTALLLLSMNFLVRATRSDPHGRWLASLVGALALYFLALGGKEIAYAVLPAVAVLLLVTTRDLRRSGTIFGLLLTLEALAFAVRWRILGGLGGYYGSEAVRGRLDGVLEFFIRPYVTDVLWPLQPLMPERLRDWFLLFLLILGILTVAVLGARAERRKLAVFGVAWQASFLGLYVAVHTSLSAYLLYVPLAGFALLVAALLDSARDWLSHQRVLSAPQGLAAGASGLGVVALLAGVLWTSPLHMAHTEFRDASFVSDAFIAQAVPCIGSAPAEVPVVVSGLPHAIVYGTAESQFIDAFVFEPYSLESVLRLFAPGAERAVDVEWVQDVLAPPSAVSVSCAEEGGRWIVATRTS